MTQQTLDLFENHGIVDGAFSRFPSTRYQGSKRKLLSFLHEACRNYTFSSVLDLYSGTCSVGLMFRSMNKRVTANDYLLYNWTTAKVLLSASQHWIRSLDISSLVDRALEPNLTAELAVSEHFDGIYFPASENRQIDDFCANHADFHQLK